MRIEILLVLWTCLGASWWIISLFTVYRCQKNTFPRAAVKISEHPLLTVFKPLPHLGAALAANTYAECLESFISQLDRQSELLLGIFEEELFRWQPMLTLWREKYPITRWQVILRKQPARTPVGNLKILWQKVLSEHASGDWWLWSDADILAPPGYLVGLLSEFSKFGSSFLTGPYVLKRVSSLSQLLDALFVNVELYPGVQLLGQRGQISFGLGAAMLFTKEQFNERINWQELTAALADDNYLGMHLQPATLGSGVLETISTSRNMQEALEHYLRWQKTICWCRPFGFAGQIVIMPLFGWMMAAVLDPHNPAHWIGLFSVALVEIVWVMGIFKIIGCKIRKSWLGGIILWSLVRPLVWCACWLPWPVRWGSQIWWKPQTRLSDA